MSHSFLEEHLGRVAQAALLERKPLHKAERDAPPAAVCVTGGAGYIGSRVAARLLACGMTVHATRRAGDDEAVVAVLNRLPGAAHRLRWFGAEPAGQGSLDAAVAGCRYVIHCAGWQAHDVPPQRGCSYRGLIEASIKGVEDVLGAVKRTPSVERVVLTSSLAAVLGGRAAGHTYSEQDWNAAALTQQEEEPERIAALASEWHAWSLAGQQQRWRLVAVCPGNVIGPILGASKGRVPAELSDVLRLMDGRAWPVVSPLGVNTVDLDDVAAAHVMAMLLPEARGRYLLCERSTLLTEVAAILRRLYPSHWVPPIPLPQRCASLLVQLWRRASGKPQPSGRRMGHWGVPPLETVQIDCFKAQWELGLTFIPLETTLWDSCDRLIELGHLRRMTLYSTAPAAVPLPEGSAHPLGVADASAVVTTKLEAAERAVEAAAGGLGRHKVD